MPDYVMATEEQIAERIANLTSMIEKHDLTYDYSDDYRVWSSGRMSLAALQLEAEIMYTENMLTPEKLCEIWNSVCDKKSNNGKQFHWEVEWVRGWLSNA